MGPSVIDETSEQARPRAPGLVGRVAPALLLLVVASVPLSVVVTDPLAAWGVLWPLYGVLMAVAFVGLGQGRAWRAPGVCLLLAFWAVLAAWVPYALRITPAPGPGAREVEALLTCAIITLVVVGLSSGRRLGLRALRTGWVAAFVMTGAVACWELVTGRHLWEDARPWPFPRDTMVASTLYNPNNYGTTLVAMLAALLAARASTTHRGARLALGMGALGGVGLVLLTESRAAAIGVVVIAGLEVFRWARERGGVRHVAWSLATARPRLSVGVTLAATIALVAAFTAPPLAARNPVLAMLVAARQPETAASDSMRLELIAAAWRYLRESGWTGTGAGSFETLLLADPTAGFTQETNLHNAFVEIAAQYGVVVAGVGLVLLVVVTLSALRAAWRRGPRDEQRTAGVEALGYLTSFALFGITASSSLPLQTWWLSLASAVAVTWWLTAQGPRA